jgi:peptidoglycan/LPS O-acetylase OafA/YrhL
MTSTPTSSLTSARSSLSRHLPFLDGLRAFAALWVLFGHCHLFVLGWTRSGTLWGRPLDLLLYSHLAVDLFLVLSGFCLALPVVANGNRLKTGLWAYFKARAWRILPPYYGALLLLLLVNAFVPIAAWGRHSAGMTGDMTREVLLANFLLLQDVLPHLNTINGPFWSIAIEWHLYFIFPLMVWVLRRFGVMALLATAGVAAVGMTWSTLLHPQWSPALPLTLPQPAYFIGLFAMGAAAAALAFDPAYQARRARLQRNGWLVGAGLCLPLCVLLWQYRIIDGANVWGFFNHLHLIDPLTGAVAAAFLLGMCGLPVGHWLRRPFESRVMVAIGTFSYSLYLTHIPILAYLNHTLEDSGLSGSAPMTALAILAFGGGALCLLFGWGFAQLFEQRLRPGRAKAAPAAVGQPV